MTSRGYRAKTLSNAKISEQIVALLSRIHIHIRMHGAVGIAQN
jgi:hypothetical protein